MRRASPRPRATAAGFTVLEVLIASAMGVLILVAAYMVYESGQSTYTRAERKTDIQQNARAAMETLVRQIRMAGFASPTQGPNAIGAIVIGNTSVLVIRGDVRQAGLPSPGADTIFALRTTTNIVCPAPPCLMSHAREVSGMNVYTPDEAQLTLAFAISSLQFNYFDANNNELAPPLDGATRYDHSPNPVDLSGESTAVRDSVRRIRVTITATDPRSFAGTGNTGPQSYTLVEDVRVRNRN